MSAWADEIDYISNDEEYDEKNLSSDEQTEELRRKAWDNAKTVVETITDSENKRYEIIKKVRSYHVDRPTTVVDIRSRWRRFGKGDDNQQDLISRDPPIVLELGDIDPLERLARDEVVRIMNEVERLKIDVTDTRLARIAKVKEERERAAQQDAAQVEQGNERTWAAARGEKSSGLRKEDTERRLRVTNISDDITKDELYNIFDTDEYRIEKLYLPTDSATGKYRGFAFITFESSDQAERCLKKTKGTARFKNTVMHIVRAIPEGEQKRN